MTISNLTAKGVIFHRNDTMSVRLSDGRTITVPLAWYPRLLNAKAAVRRNWSLCAGGGGIHWPEANEDLSIEGLLRGEKSPEYQPPKRGRKSHEYEARM